MTPPSLPPLHAMPPPPEVPAMPSIRHARLGSAIAWLVLVAGMVLAVLPRSTREPAEPAGESAGSFQSEAMARYLVGMGMLPGMKPGSQQMDKLLAEMEAQAKGPGAKFRAELLRAYLGSRWPTEEVLRPLLEADASFREDWNTVQALRDSRCSPEAWNRFEKRHGWVAKLPKAQALPSNDAFVQEVTGEATRTLVVLGGGGLLGMVGVAGGLVLLIFWIVGRRKGKYPPDFRGVAAGMGAPMLEGMAWYFTGMILIPFVLAEGIGDAWPWWARLAPGLLGVVVGFCWPRWRGVPREMWKHFTGWHLGRGFWREAGCGVVGWLACLPLLGLGLILTSWLMKASGEEVSHPIYQLLEGSGGMKWIAFGLAVVWAPITEEMTFRGLLFPGLSPRLQWWAAALLTSFIFAAIHPQGWVAVPVLMTIAMMLTTLRRWRGSLVAPMAAHACNNGSLLLLFLLAF